MIKGLYLAIDNSPSGIDYIINDYACI